MDVQKIIFFGSDEYSVIAASEMLSANCEIVAFITTPPKPKGKNKKLTPSDLEQFAKKRNGLVIHYPDNIDDLSKFISIVKTINKAGKIVGVSASFGRIIKDDILDLFVEGIINIHPSLLPQYRNVAPVPYAIALGDKVTGVTIFRIGSGIDNGELLGQAKENILANDTSPVLLKRLFVIGAKLVKSYLSNPTASSVELENINEKLVFTKRLNHESGYLEWETLQALVSGKDISKVKTSNTLINLRLTIHKDRTDNILIDLIRALDGWEKVWTIAETNKGKIQVSLSQGNSNKEGLQVLISGKPKPISWNDFDKYYLQST